MSSVADLLTGTLAEEIAAAAREGMRVFAVTTPATVVAALAARELGAERLAISGGFTALDADPVPSLEPGEGSLFSRGAVQRDWVTDVFTLLARGQAGVAVLPAQLDAAGRTNLSGIGPPGAPKVALPGARGLPDNNASPSRVWYLLGAHSPRTLVERVDVVCGPEPPPGAVRRLLTPAGLFELAAGGWRCVWLAPGGPELVEAAPGLGVAVDGDVETRAAPAEATLAALERVDPERVREAGLG